MKPFVPLWKGVWMKLQKRLQEIPPRLLKMVNSFAQADTTTAGDTTVESGLLNDTLLADEPLTDSTDAAAGPSHQQRCCCLRVAVARSSDM